MIKIKNTEVVGWEHAIRGMRNPMNSWDKSDSNCAGCFAQYQSRDCEGCGIFIGGNDLSLMKKLAKAGPVHSKYMRMIVVYCDIYAPMYWWKEFDTYKVGTVRNSCSTMHKIDDKAFVVGDFSITTLMHGNLIGNEDHKDLKAHYKHFTNIINSLNNLRDLYLKTHDKKYWQCMIEMLPSSYNQKSTVMLNYEVLKNIYTWRKNHKLDEWREFCKWIESLPYSELITGEETT